MGERCQGGERKRSPADHAVKTRIFIAAPFSPPSLTPQAITHESAGYSGSFFLLLPRKYAASHGECLAKKRGGDMYDVTSSLANKKSSVRAGHHDHYCHLCSKLPQRCTFLRQEMTVFFLFCCIFAGWPLCLFFVHLTCRKQTLFHCPRREFDFLGGKLQLVSQLLV